MGALPPVGLGEADRMVTWLDDLIADLFGQLPNERHIACCSWRLQRGRHRAPNHGRTHVLGKCLQPSRLQPERP